MYLKWCDLYIPLGGMANQGEPIATDERLPHRLRDPNTWLDIFCCVKQNLSDTHLAQNPLLVFPQSLKSETESFINRINSAPSLTPFLSPERKEELESLANEIEEDFPHLSRSLAWYRSLLVEDNPGWLPYPRLKFFEHVARAGNRWCDFNLGDRRPQPKPHALQVVFHRRGGG